MFSINKTILSCSNRLSKLSNFVAVSKVSCRHVKTVSFSRAAKKRLGFVMGGGFALGISFGNKLNISEHSWYENFKPVTVLADATPRTQYNSIADILEDKSLGIVAIDSWLTQDSNRRLYDYGVGFVDQASELIITNEGFVAFDQDKMYQVIFEDGSAYHARVVSLDNHSDLAALRLCNDTGEVRENGGIPTVKLSTSKPRLGEKLVAVTMHQNDSDPSVYKIFSGCLTTLKSEEDNSPFQMSTHCTDGAFGGPVLNADGEVVGVVSLQLHSGAALSIPYNYVQNFIERSLQHEKTVLKKEADIRRQIREKKEQEEERKRKEMEEIIEARKKFARESEKEK